MTEQECLARMKAPGDPKPTKWLGMVCQILVTHSCTLACVGCTQGSQLRAPKWFMTPEQFRLACRSLKDYPGLVGVFGGCPTLSPHFMDYCAIMREEIPDGHRGIWCNDPIKLEYAQEMRKTFRPDMSNLNVHKVERAYKLFKEGWPESMPFGLKDDSRHSPVWGSMKELGIPESERWELISRCTVNQLWSPLIGAFRGELRAWFCEIAGAQAIHHQHDPNYPDTGLDVTGKYALVTGVTRRDTDPQYVHENEWVSWWQLPMHRFKTQVRTHCHDCLVPLNGYGALAVSDPDAKEQITQPHVSIFKPKSKSRAVELVTVREQLQEGKIDRLTDYLKNSKK